MHTLSNGAKPKHQQPLSSLGIPAGDPGASQDSCATGMATDQDVAAPSRRKNAKLSKEEEAVLSAGFKKLPKAQRLKALKALEEQIEVLKKIEVRQGSDKSSKKTRSKLIFYMTVLIFVGALLFLLSRELRGRRRSAQTITDDL